MLTDPADFGGVFFWVAKFGRSGQQGGAGGRVGSAHAGSSVTVSAIAIFSCSGRRPRGLETSCSRRSFETGEASPSRSLTARGPVSSIWPSASKTSGWCQRFVSSLAGGRFTSGRPYCIASSNWRARITGRHEIHEPCRSAARRLPYSFRRGPARLHRCAFRFSADASKVIDDNRSPVSAGSSQGLR